MVLVEKAKIRGLQAGDDKAFAPGMRETLATAQRDIGYLLDQGYPAKSAITFVGNHYQLSARQLLALGRTTSTSCDLARRLSKHLTPQDMSGKTIHIDGLNIIITLEVALSDGMLFLAQDDTIRDLAELRGTYRIIPHTETAIHLLCEALSLLNVSDVVILLDAPVSNSGNLKTKLYECHWPMPLAVELVRNPDTDLKKLHHVASGDSIILNECSSWFNLVSWVLDTQGILQKLTRLVPLNTTNG